MSHTQIYLHVVFAVQKRKPVLTAGKRNPLFRHIREQASLHHIELWSINGYEDHVHLLLKLSPVQSLCGVMQQIKGESARWAGREKLFDSKLTWAKGYYARSVDPENIHQVARYITVQPCKHAFQNKWLLDYLQLIKKDE